MQGKINPRRPIDSYTKLLCHFNGADAQTSIVAATGQVLVPSGSAQLDTAQKKFGTTSLLLDGNSDYVTLPDSADWNFGSGDFTIDFWVRFNAIQSCYFYFQYILAGSQDIQFNYSGGKLYFYASDAGGTRAYYDCSWSPDVNTWYHLAVVRNGTNLYIFVNGVSQSLNVTTAISTNTLANYDSALIIGSINPYESSGYLNGWIDEYRISKGIARWTANFSVPTALYPDVESSAINFPGFQKIADFIATGNESSFSVAVDGDTDKEYVVYVRDVGRIIDVTLNGDSGTNYGEQWIVNSSGSISASRGAVTSLNGIAVDGVYESRLLCPTGFIKTNTWTQTAYTSGTTMTSIRCGTGSYNSTANITSITFTGRSGNFGSGTRICVYARRTN